MADKSAIEWTEATWNPVTGCSKVSPGCAHCYAEAISLRFGRSAGPWTPANAQVNVVLHPERLDQPLRWRRPRMIFVNSMSDLFHEEIPDDYIARVFSVMAAAPQHTFQVLTKRPERMCEFVTRYWQRTGAWGDADVAENVWLGVSIENRRFVHRADLLRETPAAVRFISAEPLLGPLLATCNCLVPYLEGAGQHSPGCSVFAFEDLSLAGIDWLIVGGESGPRHRPMRLGWARDLRDAAAATGTALFVKQLGGARPGGAIEDLPADLQIRELPRGRVTA